MSNSLKTLYKHRFSKFILVGLFNTAFGYSVFSFIYVISLNYNIALFLSTVIGTIFNFFTTGRIVFSNRSWRALPPFFLSYCAALALNFVVLNSLVYAGVTPLLAQAAALPVIVITSYMINARYVFRSVS
ncbi:GtrA family protein [Mesorhizobium sp. 1B3]|uniref:GtrA family protein n=1 Tax=Mesorhizobium sp. 1B3 TaxID=3243599 RepID=UPI003D9876E0